MLLSEVCLTSVCLSVACILCRHAHSLFCWCITSIGEHYFRWNMTVQTVAQTQLPITMNGSACDTCSTLLLQRTLLLLKRPFSVTQGRRKWYDSRDKIGLPISVPYTTALSCILFPRYCEILPKNCEFSPTRCPDP